ncbi:P-loop NTPase fold protein [Streptomyces sp. Tu102]|uniref:P-loop NTPase fold protein n=1 Tax=Streptomyces TaxID=1883 RepID=UPI00202A631A|nr:P-loop NTPase fold protein [Streptomyces sp. Tu102]
MGEETSLTRSPQRDDPIRGAGQDLLERAPLAQALAAEVNRPSARNGAVVALTGRWSCGKTSLLNLTARVLEAADDIPVVHLNPWLFSGADQLLGSSPTNSPDRCGKVRAEGQTAQRGPHDPQPYGNVRYRPLPPLKFVPGAGAVLESAGAGVCELLGEQPTVHERARNSPRFALTCRGGSSSSSTTPTACCSRDPRPVAGWYA